MKTVFKPKNCLNLKNISAKTIPGPLVQQSSASTEGETIRNEAIHSGINYKHISNESLAFSAANLIVFCFCFFVTGS